MLLQTGVFLGISVGLLCTLVKSEACQGKNFPTRCELIHRNVCFDFVGESKTWSQARSSCGERGGVLLRLMSTPIKIFLKNIISERNISNFSWWLGKDVQERKLRPAISESNTFSQSTSFAASFVLACDSSESSIVYFRLPQALQVWTASTLEVNSPKCLKKKKYVLKRDAKHFLLLSFWF